MKQNSLSIASNWCLLAVLAGSLSHAEELAFDVEKPTVLKPGAVYKFSFSPKANSDKVDVRLHTSSDEGLKTGDGESYAPIDRITVTASDGTVSDLAFSPTDYGLPEIQIEDYDCDGDRDFRVICAWGTGGSWYSYFRCDGNKFLSWKEPEDLCLNTHISNGEIAATGRSGPEYHATYYEVKNGRFNKVRVESIRMKSSLPEFKDLKDDSFIVAAVREIWKDGHLIRRTVQPQYSQ
jgi:hypothetical protein